MNKCVRFFCFVFFTFAVFAAAPPLYAKGRKDTLAETEPVNTEWTLCITAFDVSGLPVSRHITGDTVMKSLAGTLQNMSFRFRGEEEAAYYRDYAWAKTRSDAANALQAKRNERDQLIYRGDPKWRYRKNLKIVDTAIAELEEKLAEIEAVPPFVEKKPVLNLSGQNTGGIYPQPPDTGSEYNFCTSQKADGFLTGSLSEYHGRIFLSVKIYTLYTRSYSYEDSVLFSSEDLSGAMDEISGRIAAAVSETLPSAILVHVTPPEAITLIGDSFAGRGDMDMRLHSPGETGITVRSDNYLPVSFPLELNEGELAELFIDLTPLANSAFEASVPGKDGSKVFLGSLYLGETPLSFQLPRSQYSYISVETPDGETGSIVYRDNDLVRGSAHFVRVDDSTGKAAFSTKTPISPEEKRVDRARRGFYITYGTFWIVLPVSLMVSGIANSHIAIQDNLAVWNNVKLGANIAWGTALGVTLFQIIRYLYISGGDSTPVFKAVKP